MPKVLNVEFCALTASTATDSSTGTAFASNTSLGTAAYFGSAGIFHSSSATLLAEVPLATSAGGDKTDEIAISAATLFGFLAFSRTETPDGKGANC